MDCRREGFFHNDIAIPLENMARHHYGVSGASIPSISADVIEREVFTEAMISMLEDKYKDTPSENEINGQVQDFISKCSDYEGVNGSSLNKDIAVALFEEFKQLYYAI